MLSGSAGVSYIGDLDFHGPGGALALANDRHSQVRRTRLDTRGGSRDAVRVLADDAVVVAVRDQVVGERQPVVAG
jgi:hypothetical protein